MLESRRYRGDVEGVEWEHRVWGTEYRGWQCKGKDLASTYVLCPCHKTRLSLILEGTSRKDTRGLYCQGGDC